MLVGFAHVSNEHCFDVAFRVELWAAVKSLFHRVGEDFSGVKAFVFSEL
jgi:hypothetical protein